MAKKSQDAKISIPLQHGFRAVPEGTKKWLNTVRLRKLLHSSERDFRNAQGSPAFEKLMSFCEKCLLGGDEETIVTVVGQGGEGGVSYQCLFECNGAKESFVLRSSFFRDFVSPLEENKTNITSAVMPAIA